MKENNLVNVELVTTSLNNNYINHLINYIDDITNKEYFGIKLITTSSSIMIEGIDFNLADTIYKDLYFYDPYGIFNSDVITKIIITKY